MNLSHILSALGAPMVRQRTWRERLFSLPWRPWVRTTIAWPRVPDEPQVVRLPLAERPTIAPCLHCALMGTVELWQRTYSDGIDPIALRHHVYAEIDKALDDIDRSHAGKPPAEH